MEHNFNLKTSSNDEVQLLADGMMASGNYESYFDAYIDAEALLSDEITTQEAEEFLENNEGIPW